MSAAQRISQRTQARNRTATPGWEASLAGEPSELVKRLRKIRARSTATTQGSFSAAAPRPDTEVGGRQQWADDSGNVIAKDQLHWQDNLLTWTRGSTLMRTFTFSHPVLQAFWTLFQVSSPDNVQVGAGKLRDSQGSEKPAIALCVFFEQAIHIHFPGLGEQVDMDLPFRFAKAFPAPLGFLVQRQIESEDERIASKQQKPTTLASLRQASSIGYPFPDLSNSSDSSCTFSQMLDDMDQASTSQLLDDSSRLLPMVFYLSRCYDDLVPVDRFPQLSFSSTPSEDPRPMTHGPASPFGEMDETVIFVSTEDGNRFPPIVVTISQRVCAIRIYAFAARPSAFEATATLLSTPRVLSSLSTMNANGKLNGADFNIFAAHAQDTHDPLSANGAPSSETPAATSGPNSTALGRGLPSNIRRSARIDLDRRSGGLTSTGMGRDPSGRSRRISAMHSGATERRSMGRKDEQTGQGRDRTLGNISHTADGLRLQSQAYQHEAMMEELGAAGASMRITTNPTSGARLRRSSQAAARTPYGGPRGSNRTASSANKSRPSVNLSRLDSSVDTGRLTAAIAASAAEGIRTDPMEPESGHADGIDADLARIADMDGFARSFACVCLLDEIKVPSLSSQSDLATVHVRSASFDLTDPDAAYVFVSIPALDQAFARRLGYQRLSSGNRHRSLPFCKAPNKLQALPVIPHSSVTTVRALSLNSTEVLTLSSTGSFQLHFNPPSSALTSLDISNFQPLVVGLKKLSGVTSPIRLQAASADANSTIQLVATASHERVDVDLDLRPRCSTTTRALMTLAQALPHQLAVKIQSRWIQARFLSGVTLHRKYGSAAVEEDWIALLRSFGAFAPGSAPSLTHTRTESGSASTVHRLLEGDPLLSCLAPLQPNVPGKTAMQNVGATEERLEEGEAHQVLMALYLLAEEMHLDASHTDEEVSRIAHLAAVLARNYGAAAWTESLCLRFPFDKAVFGNTSNKDQVHSAQRSRNSQDSQAPPADLYKVLFDMISGNAGNVSLLEHWVNLETNSAQSSINNLSAVFPLLDGLFRAFSVFGKVHRGPQSLSIAVVRSMISSGFGLETCRRLPFGLALPLYQAIRYCQIKPPSGESAEFYRLVQRAELVMNASMQRCSLSTASERQIPKQLIRTLPDDAPLEAICAQLFSRDFRLRDVVAMLQTDSVNSVYVSEGENQTEAAITEQHNAAVAAIAERTKALPVGRAMLFMTSRLFSPTHKWKVPSICLAVKVRPRGATIEPDIKAETAGLDWPEFHNGVASVLALNLTADVKIDPKWIFAHLGEQVTARHAGFLYGLGLMKQLPTLTPVHVFRYLKMRNNLLTTGFLLGMAASTVGTADPTARHLIGMQLTAFLPPGSAPLNLSTITQTAGLLAMGLVFLGSNHRWTAKRMLDQIGALESPIANIQPQHREAYSLSAGLALGLVYLGKGGGAGMKSLPDKRIVTRLVHLVKGSSDAGDTVTLAGAMRPDDGPKEQLEINLTSAPAALAFGLIYLRSGSHMIAEIMAPPRTPGELDTLRPDVLFAHVLARSLILWDSVQPTKAWLKDVLPIWMQERIKNGKPLSEAAQLAQINMQAGACFAIGLKYAGSKNQKARDCLWEQVYELERQIKVQTVSFFSKIRKAAVRAALDQTRISLALVLAGSGDIDLLRHLRRAHGDVDGEVCYGSHMATHMALGLLFLGGGRFTLATSDLGVAALLISLLPPFPRWSGDNRAHLQAIRHLWYLAIEPRLLVAIDIDTNQLVSLPVKIASGNTTASHERAFTPLLLPNQHLPASVETATARYWPASIDCTSSLGRGAISGSMVSTAKTSSPSTSQILFVKRRTAHLDYLADPHGSRSLSSRAVETAPMDMSADATELVGPGPYELQEALRGFAEGGKHRELVRTLCHLSLSTRVGSAEEKDKMTPLMRTVVMECLTMDKLYMLPAYASMVQLGQAGPMSSAAWLKHYRSLRFADEFYRHHYGRLFVEDAANDSGEQQLLIQLGLLAKLRQRAQQHGRRLFEENATLRDTVIKHLTTSAADPLNVPSMRSNAQDFWTLLAVSEVPSAVEVRELTHTISDFIRASTLNVTGDKVHAARLRDGVRMITDTAFGGVDRAPWTTFILDLVVDKTISSVL